MIRDVPGSSVHLFTDRALGRDPLGRVPDLPLYVHAAGEARPNAGIVAFEARRDPSSGLDWEVFLEVLNASDEDREVEVTLAIDDVLLDVRPWSLPARRSTGRVFRGLPLGPGVLEARLDGDDGLAVDDRARLVVERASRTRIALVGRVHPALERALRSDPSVEVTVVTEEELRTARGLESRYAALVVSRLLPDPLPLAPLFLVEPPTRGARAPVTPAMGVVTWNRFHPVTRLVDLGALRLRSVGWPALPGGLSTLAEIGGQPLVLAGKREGHRMAVLNVDLRATDLPSRAAFPILVSSAVRWLTASGGGTDSHAVRAGEPIVFEFTAPPRRSPSRTRRRGDRAPDRGSTVSYGATERTGLYRVRWPGRATLAAVNLVSAVETDLTPAGIRPPSPATARTRGAPLPPGARPGVRGPRPRGGGGRVVAVPPAGGLVMPLELGVDRPWLLPGDPRPRAPARRVARTALTPGPAQLGAPGRGLLAVVARPRRARRSPGARGSRPRPRGRRLDERGGAGDPGGRGPPGRRQGGARTPGPDRGRRLRVGGGRRRRAGRGEARSRHRLRRRSHRERPRLGPRPRRGPLPRGGPPEDRPRQRWPGDPGDLAEAAALAATRGSRSMPSRSAGSTSRRP